MKPTKKLITEVVTGLVGEEALDIVFYLKGKTKISEFIIAEELDLEIHRARNLLYRLLEHNIVSFQRKKDKIKGWYICYWDFNESIIHYLDDKIRAQKIEHMQERLDREEDKQFYMCRNACARMDFEKGIEFNFKCPECGEIMNLQDNARTIQFLRQRIVELRGEQKEKKEMTVKKTAPATPKPVKKKTVKTAKKAVKKTTAKKKTTKKTAKKKA